MIFSRQRLSLGLTVLVSIAITNLGCDPAADAAAREERARKEKAQDEIHAFEKALEDAQRAQGIELTEQQKQMNRVIATKQVTGHY